MPEQFGLIAMLAIFMSVADSFMDSGLGAALIQEHDLTQADLSSVFYFNIIIGICASSLLSISAPWIAAFYNQPALISLTRVMSLLLISNSFYMIQYNITVRNLNFKTITLVNIIANVFSGITGIILAYSGYGVWSLVAQQLVRSILISGLYWFFNTWRPSLTFSINSLKNLFGFGSRLLLSGLLNKIFDNIYSLIIGKSFSAVSLGYFTRAQTLSDLPTQSISGMVGRVTFPLFSRMQKDKEGIKRGIRKAITTLALIVFPLMIGISVTSRPLILILFTDRWIEAVPYLQILSLIGMFYPLSMINLNVLQALGRSDLFLRLEIIKKILIVANIAITWRWGILAMLYGMFITGLISYYLNCIYNKSLIKYRFIEQIYDLLPYLVTSIIMGIGVYLVSLLTFKNNFLLFICQVFSGIIIYVLLCRIFALTAFMDIWNAALKKINIKTHGVHNG